jgi:hypothetical protein
MPTLHRLVAKTPEGTYRERQLNVAEPPIASSDQGTPIVAASLGFPKLKAREYSADNVGHWAALLARERPAPTVPGQAIGNKEDRYDQRRVAQECASARQPIRPLIRVRGFNALKRRETHQSYADGVTGNKNGSVKAL